MPSIPVSQEFPPPNPFPPVEAFPNAFADRVFTIAIDVPEFTSVCPKTGLPDFGQIMIHYVPAASCIELKAFKYYTLAYRNYGIFYENVVNRMLDDIVAAVQPRYVVVEGRFLPRGGIKTQVVARYCDPGFDPSSVELNI
jgi:7-cyano-7-deazaguanine reductase